MARLLKLCYSNSVGPHLKLAMSAIVPCARTFEKNSVARFLKLFFSNSVAQLLKLCFSNSVARL